MVWAERHQLQGGKYVIGEILGQGGFGITYKALHGPLQQQVVIKTPNEYLKNDPDYDKYVKRFIREARLLAKLSEDSHPHIVRVSDLFQEDEIHCLVMEFIPGESLSQLVQRRGALPEVDAINYIRQIGEALAFMHQAGLIHRDAHPGNIMLRNNRKAVLIDFGIAGELVPTTVSSKSFGSPFAPYEQMNGSREPTVDVYCLAATLYYAVTGERPTTSFDRKLYSADLDPPKQLNPHISDRLNKGILKGMALEAKNRPQSMHEWLKLLEAPTILTPPPVEPNQRREAIPSSFQPNFTSLPRQQETIEVKQPRFLFWIFSGGLAALAVFLTGVIGINLALMNMTEQVIQAKQAEAKNNVRAMNRAQQAYFLEYGKFSDSMIDLGIGIKVQTENYNYSIRKSTSSSSASTINGKTYNQVVSNYGISRQDNLKSYVGHVGLVKMQGTNEVLTQAIACESDAPGTNRPGDPIYQNGELACSLGTHQISRP